MKIKLSSGLQLKMQLRSLRKAKGWSQQMLAEKLGLSQSRIVQIEKNPELVSFDQLIHLFNILGVSLTLETDDSGSITIQPPSGTITISADKPKVKW
ncbi:MAG TPA: helix-turn-helix transcriptional regulator [Methylotenera sp.]